MDVINWYSYGSPFKDIAYSAPGNTGGEYGGFTGTASGLPVPDANRDANGFVKSVPSGEGSITFVCQFAPTTAQRRLSWTSKLGGSNHGCATMTMVSGGTGITYNLTGGAGGSVTYTPTDTADGVSSSPPVFRFTPVSSTDYPIGWSDRPVSDDGAVLNSEFVSLVTSGCSSAPIIRFMKQTTVERNNSPIHDPADTGYAYPALKFPVAATEPGTQLSEPIYTSANRNKNKADAEWHDGLMLESMIANITALGGHLFYNVAQNADATFYADVASVCAAFSLATGKDVYIEVGNEGWNFGYTWYHQLYNEATQLGINLEHRYAQKVIEVANYFISAFASAGVSSHLKVLAAWHVLGTTAVWDSMAAYLGTTDWAKITHLAVAPYYGDNGETALTAAGIGAGYTGSTAVLKAAIQTDQDNVLTALVGHMNKAVSLGKKLITYEGGNTLVLSDAAYKAAWARSSDAYDLELRFLQQLERQVAPLQTGGFTIVSYSLCYPFGGSSFSWGSGRGNFANPQPRDYAQTEGAHRLSRRNSRSYRRYRDHWPRRLNATVGTSLGTLTASAYGVTWSLTADDTGRVAINASTGEVTVAASLSPGGSRSFTVRQTLGAQTKDTVISYTVVATVWNDSTGTPEQCGLRIERRQHGSHRASGSGDVVIANNGHTTGTQSFIVTPSRTSGIFLSVSSMPVRATTNFVGQTANSIGLYQTERQHLPRRKDLSRAPARPSATQRRSRYPEEPARSISRWKRTSRMFRA
jgi:hypothetical protein